jgi:hypothetical protein
MTGGIVIAATLIAAEITVAPCAGRARRTRLSAVCRAMLKKTLAVFAQRNRRDDGARPPDDRPALTVSKVPTRLQRCLSAKSWNIHFSFLLSFRLTVIVKVTTSEPGTDIPRSYQHSCRTFL